jgi:hypothetical protein
MPDVLFVPRSTWFTGVPYNNDGVSPRPALSTPLSWITVHYTGMRSLPLARVQTAAGFMPGFQRSALNRQPSPASFEYNYVIPPRASNIPEVWEYAGLYRAAHSAGENDQAFGVLFLNGVDNHPSYSTYDPDRPTVWEPLQDCQIQAYRWLREKYLLHWQDITPVVKQTPHQLMPGAATACPGESILGRWNELLQPYSEPTPAPAPPLPAPTPGKESMLWRHKDFLNVWEITDANALHVSPTYLAAKGLTNADVVVDDHKQMLNSVMNKAGTTLADLVKAI